MMCVICVRLCVMLICESVVCLHMYEMCVICECVYDVCMSVCVCDICEIMHV